MTYTASASRPAGELPPRAGDGRWELLRALGAVCLQGPPGSDRVCDALGIARWTRAEHTAAFVLDLSPHSSVYLGAEGGIGGPTRAAAAGMWRAFDLSPPGEPDHLGVLLGLYAHLGESAESCRTDTASRRLEHARQVLLWEHLYSWMPVYLAAMADQQRTPDPARQWATVLAAALDREAASSEPPKVLPAALLDAPPLLEENPSLDSLLDSLVAPVSCGFILTFSDLARCADAVGAGLRRGERRFALRALLQQDPSPTLTWLARHARRWESWHARRWESWHAEASTAPDTSPKPATSPKPGLDNRPERDNRPGRSIAEWWAQRAQHSANVISSLVELDVSP